MPRVELDDKEWQQVMAVLGTAPWSVANPLLMKIGAQLHHQQEIAAGRMSPKDVPPTAPDSNGKEARHAE